MNKQTLRALKQSIKKWKRIVARIGKDHGWTDCALCELGEGCRGCPVNKDGKHSACDNTPYEQWYNHHAIIHPDSHLSDGYKIECKICERHAKAELAFLQSLLPK